jgi:metal-responsive CopG/Arc/MetJ family transcriptional regulator
MSELQNRERFGVALNKVLLEGLRKLSTDTRIPASKLLDEAIEDLLKKYKLGLEAHKAKESREN